MSGNNNNGNNITSRQLCLEVIINVLEKGQFLKETLHAVALKDETLDARERAFITTLATGTIERKIQLDYVIGLYSKVKVEKLKPYIRNILRMSIYQIMYMDKVPDNAAVNEAVKLAVKKGYSGLRGFVNGVLRNVARTHIDIKWPDKESDYVKYCSIRYSMPDWLVKHFMSELTDSDIEICMEYFAAKSELTLRPVDIKRADELKDKLIKAGYEVKNGNIVDYALRIVNPGKVEDIPGYSTGEFVVQDESAMLPAHVAYLYYSYLSKNEVKPLKKGVSILDMCAAPGGKIMHARSLFGDNASYIACDINYNKTDKIKKNLVRAGMTDINVKVADALVRYEDNKEKFDIIIADLPCSGLGVIAKKSDIKYNTQPDDLASLARIQADMLDNAAYYAKHGGVIVFSTCTVNKAENEDNCRTFLERHDEFERLDISEYIPEALKGALTEDKELLVVPGVYESDGFFVALFRKTGV